jgi:hypothetical protein
MEQLGVNFVECAGGKIIIIELPDKEPDGSISNNLCMSGSTALRVKRIR